MGVLAACDDDDDAPPLASEMIGPAGGSMVLPDGSVSLTVPANALAGDVAFRIDPGQISIVPGFFDVAPAWVIAPESTVFATPAQVVVPYAPEAVPDSVPPGDLRVGFRNATGQVSGIVPLQVDPNAGRVTVETTGLGTFWVASPDVVAAADLFPLNDGDTYRFDSGLILTVSHTAIEPNFQPAQIAKVTFSSIGLTTGLYFEVNGTQLRQLGSFDVGYSQERFESPVLWIESRDSIGVVRPVVSTFLGYRPFGSSFVGYTGLAQVTTRIAERVEVATRLGTFETVRVPVTTQFSTTEPMLGEELIEFWFAEGVGPVQIRLGSGLTPLRLEEATVDGQPVTGS